MSHKHCIAIVISLLVSTASAANKYVPRSYEDEKTIQVNADQTVRYTAWGIIWRLTDGSWGAIHAGKIEEKKECQKNVASICLFYGKQTVSWVGSGIPVCIRAKANKLYMITFDRETDFSKIEFRYYKQNDNRLVEISPETFPKDIAVQNLWLTEDADKKLVREMDPSHAWFRRSLTAKIWWQLTKGKKFYEVHNRDAPETLLKEYKKKYSPTSFIPGKEANKTPTADGKAAAEG